MEALLTEAIRTYCSLAGSVYELTFKEGEQISLKFEVKSFYHLFGFQYLENLNRSRQDGKSESIVDKAILFKNLKNFVVNGIALSGNPTYARKISTSRQFPDLKNRLELARDLTYFLEAHISKNSYWNYIRYNGVKTHIKWDYLIDCQPHKDNPRRYYLFIRKDEQSEYYVPVSLFKTDALNHLKEYSYQQSRKTILSVTKRCDVL